MTAMAVSIDRIAPRPRVAMACPGHAWRLASPGRVAHSLALPRLAMAARLMYAPGRTALLHLPS
jgi:hypothetical protein